MPLVLDISSDEEEGLEGGLNIPEPDYDWIREFLHNSDDESDGSDEVVVVHENKPELRSKSSTLAVKDVGGGSGVVKDVGGGSGVVKDVGGGGGGGVGVGVVGGGSGSGDDDDDCVVLESDPEKGVASVAEEANESDELVVVGEKGQIACRDYPHPRHLCAKLPFSSTPHEKYCSQCHCYVCDSLAPCPKWGTGMLSSDHCHANDKIKEWKTQRTNFKLGQASTNATSTFRQEQAQHNESPPLGVNLSPNSVLPNQASKSTAMCTTPSLNSMPQIPPSCPAITHSLSVSSPNSIVQNQVSGPINMPIISPATNMTMANSANHGRSQESRSTFVRNRSQPPPVPRPLLGVRSHTIQRERGNGTGSLRPVLLPPHMMSGNLRPQLLRPHMMPNGGGSVGNTPMVNNSSHGSSAFSNHVNMPQQHVNYHTATGLPNFRNHNGPDNVYQPTNTPFFSQPSSQPVNLSHVNQHTMVSSAQAYNQPSLQPINGQDFHQTRCKLNEALSGFSVQQNSSQQGNEPQIRNQNGNTWGNTTQSRNASHDTFHPQSQTEALSSFAAQLNSSQHGNEPQIRSQNGIAWGNTIHCRTASHDTFQPQPYGEPPRETAENFSASDSRGADNIGQTIQQNSGYVEQPLNVMDSGAQLTGNYRPPPIASSQLPSSFAEIDNWLLDNDPYSMVANGFLPSDLDIPSLNHYPADMDMGLFYHDGR